jgi:LuxR family transcriptional regulator, maltose regulon positive regulatory protein
MSETTEQATSSVHRHIIERPRLMRLLDETPARVIMLVAPAGYGKTTLARQWLANRPHAWLQANESSSDVVALAVDLAKALAMLGSEMNRHLLERVRTLGDPRRDLRTLAELQAEALGPWPEGCWAAIDDYDYVTRSDVTEEYVRLLLEATDMRLLVASRVNPRWATARARLYGDFYVVDRADLAMRVTETRAVLQAAPETRVSQILSLADGWPALIGLASLTDLDVHSAADLSSTLFDYFADELFHRGSRSLQTALPQLALAPHITPDLAASIFGPRKGPELLREAKEIGFFSATAADLRLHPLLKRFLLTKLERDAGDEVAHRLIEFFLARSEWDDAFELIRQQREIAALVELCVVAHSSMLSSGRATTLDSWLELAAELGAVSPVFDLIRADLALRDGKVEHASRLAQRVIDSDQANDYRSRALIVAGRSAHLNNRETDALAFFQASALCAQTDQERHEATWGCLLSAEAYEDDEDLTDVLNQFLAQRPDGADDVIRAANARIIVAFVRGDIEGALDLALDALPALDHTHDPLIRTSFLNNLSHALSLQARYVEGGSLADRLVADAHHARLDFVLPHAYVAKAVALIGTRSYADAEGTLKEAERLASDMGDRHNMLDARTVRAKLLITVRDYSQALGLLADIDDAATVTSTMRAEMLATRGLGHACVGHLEDANVSLAHAERLSSFPEIRSLVACARTVLRLRQTSDPNQAFKELAVALELSILDPIVLICRAFPELIRTASAVGGLPQAVIGVVSGESQRSGSAFPAGGLTRRETDVLKLISLGYTNREIARELFIAEVTAKVHVRNIIRKLGVRSRTEAAIVAIRGAADPDDTSRRPSLPRQ